MSRRAHGRRLMPKSVVGSACGPKRAWSVDYRRRSEIRPKSLLFHGAITPFTREVVVITVAGDLASSFRWLQWRDRAGIAPASHLTSASFRTLRHRGVLWGCLGESYQWSTPARAD